ncbi:AAA family ATPase [Micromonospora taraxaci]|uniref:NACHT domain-containing protein n=1 Tax=Micromonospora taraxaci TaxID=1316803 RepID=UPI003405C656
MPRLMSFPDAVRIIGVGDSKLIKWIDGILSAGLAAAAPATGGLTIGLFDPKNDLVKWLERLRIAYLDKLSGASGRPRGEVMTASHTILLVSAYFDTLAAGTWLEEDILTPDQQWHSIFRTLPPATGNEIIRHLLQEPPPAPTPGRSREEFRTALRDFFTTPTREVLQMLMRHPSFELQSANNQIVLDEFINYKLPAKAMEQYDGYVLQLAGISQEFLCWTLINEHTATFGELGHVAQRLNELDKGLAGIIEALPAVSSQLLSRQRWTELANGYRAMLTRPILPPGSHGSPAGLVIPNLGEAYVNHAFRAVTYDPEKHVVHDDHWWGSVPQHEEIQGFLAACLADPAATEQPILLLGHPGAGKSVMVRVLAARLAELSYPTVRVDLRRVAADASVHRQISEALALALHRTVEWADLADATEGAVPVVLLDGLDELIQSSQASRSDYLEQVSEFQRTEADRGFSLIVLVTSRTTVAHQVRIPRGATVVHLEPFDDRRIRTWVEIWNSNNVRYFNTEMIDSLAPKAVLRHRHLACQPLMLLMLALYDADGNALQKEHERLGDAELYDRLLNSFGRREVQKLNPAASGSQIDDMVAQELLQLSVAAFAMFNRDSQVVTERELDSDLSAVTHDNNARSRPSDRQKLTPGQLLIGRFYFVHASESTYQRVGEGSMRAYEFVHATFGEYLVARLTTQTLLAMEATHSHQRRVLPIGVTRADDELLTALLSYQVLAMRRPVVSFVRSLLAEIDQVARSNVRILLVEALATSLQSYDVGRFAEYRPRELDLTARLATRSANLVLLLLITYRGEASFIDLFPYSSEPFSEWQRLTTLWHACLDPSAWASLTEVIAVPELHAATGVSLNVDLTSESGSYVDELDRANNLTGNPLQIGLAEATFHFRIMDQPVILANRADYPKTPAAALMGLAISGPDDWHSADNSYVIAGDANQLVQRCLDHAASLGPQIRSPFLYLTFRQLRLLPAPPRWELLLTATQLLTACSPSSSKGESARALIGALAEWHYHGAVDGDEMAELARIVLPCATEIVEPLVQQRISIESFNLAVALAELGVIAPTDSRVGLEEILENSGAAWRTTRGDVWKIARLIRAVRISQSAGAAVGALRLLRMLPGPKLRRLRARDVLAILALANKCDPQFASEAAANWQMHRRA